jgi:hypothetical protein
LEDGYGRAKESVEDRFDAARRTFEEKRTGAKDALDAGRAAVHSARDELERRLAQARAEGVDADELEDVEEEEED